MINFCLLVPLDTFSLIWRRHHDRWMVEHLTYARQFWPLSSEGFFAGHTYCDTGHPIIMLISEDPWRSNLLQSVWQWRWYCLFLRLRSVAAEIRRINLPRAGRTLLPTVPLLRLKKIIDSFSDKRSVGSPYNFANYLPFYCI